MLTAEYGVGFNGEGKWSRGRGSWEGEEWLFINNQEAGVVGQHIVQAFIQTFIQLLFSVRLPT